MINKQRMTPRLCWLTILQATVVLTAATTNIGSTHVWVWRNNIVADGKAGRLQCEKKRIDISIDNIMSLLFNHRLLCKAHAAVLRSWWAENQMDQTVSKSFPCWCWTRQNRFDLDWSNCWFLLGILVVWFSWIMLLTSTCLDYPESLVLTNQLWDLPNESSTFRCHTQATSCSRLHARHFNCNGKPWVFLSTAFPSLSVVWKCFIASFDMKRFSNKLGGGQPFLSPVLTIFTTTARLQFIYCTTQNEMIYSKYCMRPPFYPNGGSITER